MPNNEVNSFLQQYHIHVSTMVAELRRLVVSVLPGVTEQLDLPAKMIAYCYGQRYTDMICTIHPSGKGVKLGFYKGAELADPSGMLEGTGKLSRYVIINRERIHSPAIRHLLEAGLKAYHERMEKRNRS